MKDFILKALAEVQNGYSLCGVVDCRARVYPLGSDTKVISTLYENRGRAERLQPMRRI